MTNFTGGCLCGKIKYVSTSEPKLAMNCHCKDCRKASGGPYLANVFIMEEFFSLEEGVGKYYEQLSATRGRYI